jgi:iron complex outermembrane receptor protein
VLFGLDLLKRDRLDADQQPTPAAAISATSLAVARLVHAPVATGCPTRAHRKPFANCPTGSQLRLQRFRQHPARPGLRLQREAVQRPAARRERLRSLSATYRLQRQRRAFADVLYSHNKADQIFSAPLTVGPGLRAYNPATGTLIDVPAVLPVGHPNNPGSTPLPFEYTFFDLARA